MDWMGMGITRSKPEHPLRKIDVEQYRYAYNWVCDKAERIGWRITRAVFVPETATWYFYEIDQLIIRLDHDTMERIWDVLRKPVEQAVADHEADVADYLKSLQEFKDNNGAF